MNLTELSQESELLFRIPSNDTPPQCKLANLATFACFNKSCDKEAFVCQHKGCECRKAHQECLMIEVDKLMQNFKSRIHTSKPLEDYINENIDKMIDYLSDLREKALQNIQQSFVYYGLNESQSTILYLFETGQVDQLTGKFLFSGYSSLKEKEEVQKGFGNITKKIESIFKFFQNEVQRFKFKLDRQIQFHKIKIRKIKQRENTVLFENSKVITKASEIDTFKLFFQPKTLLSAELLYRASENDFQMSKFHEKCDDIPNTLIVIDQEFGNKIGGFTPICWQHISPESKEENWYKRDDSMESFIFSLPNKDKFTLTKPQSAIHIRGDGVIKFGEGADLFLHNKANENNKSFSSICYSYVNPNYKQNDKESKSKYLGSTKGEYYFKVKEWEVWKIEFQ